MDNISLLLEGFVTALQPQYLLFAFLGVLVGTAVGVLPGIGPAMTVALLLPLTYTLDPTAALITFAGIYYGGMYGGSTTSILLNTPGESASIITAIEGNKMARLGRAATALATAAIGSFIAGTIATVGLTLLAPVLAQFAVSLGPADYVALIVVAFITVGALLGSSVARGMSPLGIGLFIGLIGTDLLSGQARYTLGLLPLADGIDVVLVAVGLFAVGETFYVAARLRHGSIPVTPVGGSWRHSMKRDDWRRSWAPWLRGTAIGFPIGTIPAGGADVATFLVRDREEAVEAQARVRPRRDRRRGGAGVGEQCRRRGRAGAPADARAADDGDRRDHPHGVPVVRHPAWSEALREPAELVWALIASLYIGNVMLIVLNLPLVGMWAKVLRIPRPYLYAGIMTFAALGAYAVSFQPVDVFILLVIGVLGFFMRRYGYPVAPLVVGMILGPMGEEYLRKALQQSQGDVVSLFLHPFAAVAYGVLAVLIIGGLWLKRRRRKYEAAMEQALTSEIAVQAAAETAGLVPGSAAAHELDHLDDADGPTR